jgi:hypothetical protein
VIWTEAERREDLEFTDFMEEGLEDGLTTEMRSDRFCDETLDDHVARFCLMLGLRSEDAERWRDLPDPPDDDPHDPPDRMSSG